MEQQPTSGSQPPRYLTLERASKLPKHDVPSKYVDPPPELQALAKDVARLQAMAAKLAPYVDKQIPRLRALTRRLAACRGRMGQPRVQPLARPRARRERPCGRRHQRRVARSTSSSDPPDDPEPPRLKLWRHERYGSVSPALLRILLEVA